MARLSAPHPPPRAAPSSRSASHRPRGGSSCHAALPESPHTARVQAASPSPDLCPSTSSPCLQSQSACSGLSETLDSESSNRNLRRSSSPCLSLLTATSPTPPHLARAFSPQPRPSLTTSSTFLQSLLACSGLLNLFQPVQGGRQYQSLLTLTLHQSSLRVRVFSPSPHPA